ncbi:MAG: rhomboid family intramembrane serine protease [Archaeoglobaceae archaeon]|nr:rhomboid family intramembrane serine protease [Archaeoglobaceae archaeon]
MKCDVCGKEVYLPFKCKYCGGTFCSEHRLPEKHNCIGFKNDKYWNVPVKVKKEKKPKLKPIAKIPDFPKPKTIAAYGYNNLIMALCTILFFISIIARGPIIKYLAFNPITFIIMPWQIITSIFLHVDFNHFLVNMIVLLFFGTELERRVGSSKYLRIFLLSGLTGNVAYLVYAYATSNLYPALGASAAIFGVMGTLAIIAPEIRVLLFFILPLRIRDAIILFALFDVVGAILMADNVAHVAHLAGLVVGLYYGRRLKRLRYYGY